jgi:hypothetical protein
MLHYSKITARNKLFIPSFGKYYLNLQGMKGIGQGSRTFPPLHHEKDQP